MKHWFTLTDTAKRTAIRFLIGIATLSIVVFGGDRLQRLYYWRKLVKENGLQEMQQPKVVLGIPLYSRTMGVNGVGTAIDSDTLSRILTNSELRHLSFLKSYVELPLGPPESSVRDLYLVDCELGPTGIENLNSWVTLRNLGIVGFRWPTGQLKIIEELGLIRLLVTKAELTTDDLASIGRLDDLEYLDLEKCILPTGGLRQLAVLTKLRRLNIAGVDLGCAGQASLANYPALTTIIVKTTSEAVDLNRILIECGGRPICVSVE